MAKIFRKQEHEAVTLLTTQAHEHGSMLAMGALGYCYAKGNGVPQNFVEAYIWFNLAAAVGLRAAAEDRDRFADKMSVEQLVQAQRKAADTFWPGAVSRGLRRRLAVGPDAATDQQVASCIAATSCPRITQT